MQYQQFANIMRTGDPRRRRLATREGIRHSLSNLSAQINVRDEITLSDESVVWIAKIISIIRAKLLGGMKERREEEKERERYKGV